MDYRSLLNEHQYEAVSTRAQYCRIVAGAGSGKTRVLTYRISYLIGERGVDPQSIVAIAFTNKVANEMKTRALDLLGGMGEGLTVSTFHSFCAKFLRKEIDALGFPNNFTIMDEDDVNSLIKNIAVDFGFKKNDDIVKKAIGFIGYQKMKGNYPEDIVVNKHDAPDFKKTVEFFHEYEKRKEAMMSLDFDDLLLYTIRILQEFHIIRHKWQNRISHILIDEFQDTNDVQYKLVKLLMRPDTCLYVVGDPDQTIYTWRGANQKIILDFNVNFKDAETIILDRNYRSTKTILGVANRLIANNKKRVPKDLYTENTQGGPVEVKILKSREYEAKFIVDQIEKIKREHPLVSYNDIAVLYRAAYLTLPVEKELMSRKIQYRIYGGVKFFQRKEIKDVLAYFRLIYNQKDDISFERIVNVPARKIGDKTLDILKAEKNAQELSYLEYIRHLEKFTTALPPKAVLGLTALVNLIDSVKAKLDEGLEAYPQLLQNFIMDIGYYEYLKSDDETAEERLGNVKTLFDSILDFAKNNQSASFEEYLENASLQTSQDEIVEGDSLNLMTIHVAKGLEFKYVFLMGMSEDIFPSKRTMDESGDDGIEEERRLCYVAFTRAKEKLFITANTGFSFVLNGNSDPSRFIREAGLSTMSSPNLYNRDNRYRPDRERSLFDDEPVIKYAPKREDPIKPISNGISDWKVGDIAIHDKFGRGEVINVVDDTIIEIRFESCGVKSIMSTHPMVHREEKGIA